MGVGQKERKRKEWAIAAGRFSIIILNNYYWDLLRGSLGEVANMGSALWVRGSEECKTRVGESGVKNGQ